MSKLAVYFVFFLSGISGLVYQVIWVRVFGNVFGNTIHSATVVTAVFLSGLGLGSYVVGRLADRKFQQNPHYPLLLYGYSELLIGGLCLILAFLLPRLTALSVLGSSYVIGNEGWHELSLSSHLFRYSLGIVLLAGPSFLMGGTLTLLIRFMVGRDTSSAGWKIGLLYGLNTFGAAVGCFFADFALVPQLGIFGTQLVAVSLNWIAGIGALLIIAFSRRATQSHQGRVGQGDISSELEKKPDLNPRRVITTTAIALFLSGFAAMGMEIVWFRFLTSILGGLRSVFSLLLAVILVGIWLGSLLGGYLHRRWGRPVMFYMIAQSAFVTLTLGLFVVYDGSFIFDYRDSVQEAYENFSELGRTVIEYWTNLRLILLIVGLPAVAMGLTFPLGNAIVQRLQAKVGRRAGTLYLSNTSGNVLGSIAAGFVFLPALGVQASISIFGMFSVLSIFPLYYLFAYQSTDTGELSKRIKKTFLFCLITVFAALVGFSLLPRDYLLKQIFEFSNLGTHGKVLTVNESVTETLMISEIPGLERRLHTNGYSMSSTGLSAQRYMGAFAHIPLLQIESPRRVLVICFGVGNTLYAASLHKTIEKLEVVDISRSILEHAGYFRRKKQGILNDPRVSVFINDGRHHLLMQEEGIYDLITLEPPPISEAGVSSLFTREFYELAKTRLQQGGFVSQWLPALQLSEEEALSLIRAFVEVFPESVLLNGFFHNMILIGRKGKGIELDIDLVEKNIAANPAVQKNLNRMLMGTLTELVGSFTASSETLTLATQNSITLEDDHPIIEYSIRSKFKTVRQPKSIFDVSGANKWCPGCFTKKRLSGELINLKTYFKIMEEIYASDRFLLSKHLRKKGETFSLKRPDDATKRTIAESRYLQILLWARMR